MIRYLLCLAFMLQKVFAQQILQADSMKSERMSYSSDSSRVIMGTKNSYNSTAGNPIMNSEFGYAHTPKGNLHMMIIYAGFDDADEADDYGEPYVWKHDTIPMYATGDSNYLMNRKESDSSNNNNLTKWFKVMSNGKFTITGETFWVRIGKKSQLSYGNFFEMYNKAFIALQQKYPNEDWSRFDQRQNNPQWEFDNSLYNKDGTAAHGDGIIDYVVVNIRNLGGYLGQGASDANMFAGNSIKTNFGGGKIFQFGAGHSTDFMPIDWMHHHDYFRHEFSHVLFNSPHYFGANNLCGKHFYTNLGWGIMGTMHKPINSVNAWEKWYLGWNRPKEIYRNGLYKLNDFITQNDALRMNIPGTDQFLFIENHQMKHELDDKIFYKTESPMGKGIYAFISAKGNSKSNPESFSPSNNMNTNNFKILSAKGNWDYNWKDTNNTRAFYKLRENPIAGQTDLTLIRQDFKTGDNLIFINNDWNNTSAGKNEQDGVLNEEGKMTYAWSGSAKDAFQLHNEIGISGIVPALNYPYYNENNLKQDTVFINGLSIKIADYDSSTGSYNLNIKFDDFELRKNTRWCGEIALKNVSNDNHADLIIKPRVILRIDKSGTPNVHAKGSNSEFPDFIRPSALTIYENACLFLENKSKMIIDDSSLLSFRDNGKLEMKMNSELVIRNKSRLMVSSKCSIQMHENAKIIFEDQRKYLQKIKGNYFEFYNGNKIRVSGNLTKRIMKMNSKGN